MATQGVGHTTSEYMAPEPVLKGARHVAAHYIFATLAAVGAPFLSTAVGRLGESITTTRGAPSRFHINGKMKTGLTAARRNRAPRSTLVIIARPACATLCGKIAFAIISRPPPKPPADPACLAAARFRSEAGRPSPGAQNPVRRRAGPAAPKLSAPLALAAKGARLCF